MHKLNVKAFTLAGGVCWSSFILFIGWVASFGWGTSVVDVFSSLYIGYAPTFVGGLVGGAWAFCDGAIGGLIFVLVYNALLGKKK